MNPHSSLLEDLPAYGAARAAVEILNRELQVLAEQVFTDRATDLPNQGAFEVARSHLDAQQKNDQAAVFCDLKNFKQLNETEGADAGDSALRAFADSLRVTAKGFDGRAYRRGGDEFVVVLPGAQLDLFVEHAAKVLAKVTFTHTEQDRVGEGRSLSVEANIGVARPEEGVVFSELLKRSEAAAKYGKSVGEERVQEWTTNLETQVPVDIRRRCESCYTTVALLIPAARTHATLSCPVCQKEFAA